MLEKEGHDPPGGKVGFGTLEPAGRAPEKVSNTLPQADLECFEQICLRTLTLALATGFRLAARRIAQRPQLVIAARRPLD
jgi:hypothetical protein